MTVKTAQPCGCLEPIYQGKKARRECEHGNPFLGKQLVKGGEKKLNLDKPRRGSSLKRTSRRESKAERAARDHFNETVKAWPCWFAAERPCEKCEGRGGYPPAKFALGSFRAWVECEVCRGDGSHHCQSWGRKDAHHLIPKQFIRSRFSHLPEDQLLAILFNPKLGAPLCRKAHDRLEAGFDRIYWEDLTDECIEYVGSLPDFTLLRLEEECPKRSVPASEREAA